MNYFFKIVLVCVVISFLQADDFDDMFEDGASSSISASDDMFEDKKPASKTQKSLNIKSKSNDDDFLDELDSADNYSNNRVKFNALIKDAYDYAKDKKFNKAYNLLNQARRMNFDNQKVAKVRDYVEKKQENYLTLLRDEQIMNQQAQASIDASVRAKRKMINSISQKGKEYAKINEKIRRQAKRNALETKRRQRLAKLEKQKEEMRRLKKKKMALKIAQMEQKAKAHKVSQTPKKSTITKKVESVQKSVLVDKKPKTSTISPSKKQEDKQIKKQNYMQRVKGGIKLAAKKCYGGHYVGGYIPEFKPEVVVCMDVYFEARCKNNSHQIHKGVLTAMVSNVAGCFGDNVEVKPKLSCEAEDYVVKVTQVKECGAK